jgi:hypothetical protein
VLLRDNIPKCLNEAYCAYWGFLPVYNILQCGAERVILVREYSRDEVAS